MKSKGTDVRPCDGACDYCAGVAPLAEAPCCSCSCGVHARVVLPGGTVLVSKEELHRWRDESLLRKAVWQAGSTAGGGRLFAVCTTGGYLVDVWEVDHWQSGAEPPTGGETP